MNTEVNQVKKKGIIERIKESAYRIRSLLYMQIGDKLRRRTKEERHKFIFRLFLMILGALVVTAALTAVCILLESMFYVPLGKNMLAAVLLISQLVTVLANVGTIQRVLFSNKENALLITFPCNYSDIILSKLILFLLNELKKNCFFLLPFLIGFGIATSQGIVFYLFVPVVYVILSLIPIFLDCVLSVLFLYGKRIIFSKPLLCVISTLAFFSVIFIGVYEALQLLPNPLKFLQEYSKYIAAISKMADKVAKYSLHYGSIANVLMGDGSLIDVLIIFASTIGVIIIGLLIIVPFYFRFLNSISERSDGRSKSKKLSKKIHKGTNRKKGKSLYRVFLKKELIETFRDTHKLSNIVASFIILPMISYIMNYVLDTINTNPMGEYMVIAFNVMVSASLLAAFNTECAYALSAEGGEFAILKSSPNNTAAITWSKITITLISNLVAIGVTVVMLYFTVGIKILDLALFVLVLFLLAAGMVLWSFQLDVRRPLFAEYASKGSSGVVDNPNVGLATLIGFIVATLAGAFTLLMLYDDYITGWIRIIAVAGVFCLARIYIFYRNLHVYFREIEL